MNRKNFTSCCRGLSVAVAMALWSAASLQAAHPADSLAVRPAYVNNAETPYFPPVFNQDRGSCGSASRIGYMFTHELNAFRGADASLPENIYPTHFTWLLTNSNSGKEGMAKANGVPRSTVYGGTTYSRLFGNQDCADADFGWMQGYDKWFGAMFNRISHNSFSPYGVDTPEGRELVKNWLWNHNGDPDFKAGGICGIGVASACKQAPIGADPEGRNAAAGVVGKKYVTRWGDGVDHALTIVGYDDRIVFDLDSNSVYGEVDKDECGAWIIVNSWGSGWANGGFIYCPYKYGFPVRQNEGGAWRPEFYHVRKNYRPLRTLKVLMDYSRRSELKLSVGIAADLEATEPEAVVEMEHFKYAGDGRSRREKQGLESRTPLLGKWADGRLHDEPMEFGYDLTDLSAGFDTRRPLKYFFIIETLDDAIGTGVLRECSLLDYEFDRQGIEVPFALGRGKRIANHGARTVVSVVVGGEPFFAPRNFRSENGRDLVWDRPQASHYRPVSYVMYKNDVPVDTLPLDVVAYRCDEPSASYALAALYDGAPADTALVRSALTPEVSPAFVHVGAGRALTLHHGGMTIPRLSARQMRRATLEYWLKPYTWRSWNQCLGPGWGNFLIHANDNGSLTAGWDGENRMDTRPGLIEPGEWHHFAFTVARDTLIAYVDGAPVDTLVRRTRNGGGGFSEFPLGGSEEGGIDGELAELRIWRKALTAGEVADAMHRSYEAESLPDGLLAYYKGQLMGSLESGDKCLWRDFAGTRHARLAAFGRYEESAKPLALLNADTASVAIVPPRQPLYAGQAVSLRARCTGGVTALRWEAPEAGVEGLRLSSPTLVFPYAGNFTVRLTGQTADGRTLTTEQTLRVDEAPLNADFRPTAAEGKAGERISFHPLAPLPGYRYAWSLPGAEVEEAATQSAAATYPAAGDYRVKLRVTDPSGRRSRTRSYRIHVRNVAPQVQFELSAHVVPKGSEVTLTDHSRFAPTAWQWRLDSRRYSLHSAKGREATVRMNVPGVYDVTLIASNEEGSSEMVKRQALVVCNADSKNGLVFGDAAAQVTTRKPLWDGETEGMTVDWWMNADEKGRRAGMGHSRGTWLMEADERGRLTFHADSLSVRTGDGFLLPGSWHHYAVTFLRGEVRFLRDGECLHTARLKNKERSVERIPAFAHLRLGGAQTPMGGVVDELRVWQKALDEARLRHYCNAPIDRVDEAGRTDSLRLYYTFNQSGGDVRDSSSHGNDGERSGFGPDGDAWGLSAGVFSLNFETPLTDVTDSLMPGSRAPFATDGTPANMKKPGTYLTYAAQGDGWTAERFAEDDSVRTGICVDADNGRALRVATHADGFADRLENHKFYRTLTLAPGKYELEVALKNARGIDRSRLLVARGKGLPDLNDTDEALASCPLAEKRLLFVLTEETTVSLGMLFNLERNAGTLIERIELRRAVVE